MSKPVNRFRRRPLSQATKDIGNIDLPRQAAKLAGTHRYGRETASQLSMVAGQPMHL